MTSRVISEYFENSLSCGLLVVWLNTGETGVVTLSQLLSTWVVHDLGHIGQIMKVMAKQYDAAVGAWQAYLPVLSRV
jgi:hypothetical protein